MEKLTRSQKTSIRKHAARDIFQRTLMGTAIITMPIWYLPAALVVGLREMGLPKAKEFRPAIATVFGADRRTSSLRALANPNYVLSVAPESLKYYHLEADE